MGACEGAEHQPLVSWEDGGALLLPATRGRRTAPLNQGTGSCLGEVSQ